MTLGEVRYELERRKGQHRQLSSDLASTEEKVKELSARIEDIGEAQAIIQTVAKATQELLEYHISELVSLALASVFPDPYKLKLVFELRRGKSEADLLFVKKGAEPVSPMEASGGGAVDVAAFGLRLSLWSLQNPRSRPTLIFDEPFRYLSRDLQQKASQMLREISMRLGIQMIIVTHEPNLLESADRVFEVGIKGRESNVGVYR